MGAITADKRTALNGLRAFACLMIVVFHFETFSSQSWFSVFPSLKMGFLGVDFFFVLSGLIINHVYFEAVQSGRENLRRFLFLRLSRLFPLHALLMALMLVCALAVGKELSSKHLIDWLAMTLLVHQWTLPPAIVWNFPAWSISAEMFAYAIIFPLILATTARMAHAKAGGVLILTGIALIGLLFHHHVSLNIVTGIGPLIRVAGGFALGAGLFRIAQGCLRTERWDLGMATGVVVCVLGLLAMSELMLLGGLVCLTFSTYMSTGPLAARLSTRWLYLAGEYSFALYLCHAPIFKASQYVTDFYKIEQGVLFCLIVLGICIVSAILLSRYVEIPCREALRKWYDAGTPLRTAVPAG